MQRLIILSLLFSLAGHLSHAQWTVRHLDENAYTYRSTIKFLDDSTGLFMGSNSTILKSRDAGDTWNAIDIEARIDVTDFQFVNDSVIHAVGYRTPGTGWDSKMIRSEDKGDSWHSVSDFSRKQLMTLWFFDNDSGLVAGYDGIYRTVDSGASWDTVWSFHQSGYRIGELRKLCFPSEQVGYAVGTGIVGTPLVFHNLLLKTTNSGLTWDKVQTFSGSLTTVYFTEEDTGFIGTEGGMILKTTDGGNTWNETQISEWQAVNSIHFISTNIGFATGGIETIATASGGGLSFFVAKTTDGGESWVSYDTTGIPLNSIHFLNDSIGFVSGLYGLIMKTEGRIDQLPDDYPWHLAGSIAQTQWAPIGAEWYYSAPGVENNPLQGYTRYVSDRDTLIEDKICRIIQAGNHIHIMRMEDNKVYYHFNDDFRLIYDFGAKVGDTVSFDFRSETFYGIDTTYAVECIVDKIDTIIVNGMNLRKYQTSVIIREDLYWLSWPIEYIYTERIGYEPDFMFVLWGPVAGDPKIDLRCYRDKDIFFMTDWWASMNLDCDHSEPTGSIQIDDFFGETLVVFPNPTTGIINLTLSKKIRKENFEVIVYDMTGKKVYSSNLQSEQETIDLSHLPGGVYHISIRNNGLMYKPFKLLKL